MGILTFLREPLHILVWNGKLLGGFLPQYREPTVGLCLVVVLATFYVAVAAGAAWARSSTLGIAFRHAAYADCWAMPHVRL